MDKKINIMLVEDDNNLGQLIQDSLEINNYTVDLFRNGQEGWRITRRIPTICSYWM